VTAVAVSSQGTIQTDHGIESGPDRFHGINVGDNPDLNHRASLFVSTGLRESGGHHGEMLTTVENESIGQCLGLFASLCAIH